MTKFKFRLQSILHLAISHRNERRRELAKANEAVQVLADRHRQLSVEHHDIRHARNTASVGANVKVARLLDASRYELMLFAQISDVAKQQAEVQEELEQRRQRLVESDRRVRTLEKLRDRKLAVYTLKQERKQQRKIDDVATQRYTSQTRLARENSQFNISFEEGASSWESS
jgi:flagellar FliJ protein